MWTNLEATQKLLDHDRQLHYPDTELLHIAVQCSQKDLAGYFLEREQDPAALDNGGLLATTMKFRDYKVTGPQVWENNNAEEYEERKRFVQDALDSKKSSRAGRVS